MRGAGGAAIVIAAASQSPPPVPIGHDWRRTSGFAAFFAAASAPGAARQAGRPQHRTAPQFFFRFLSEKAFGLLDIGGHLCYTNAVPERTSGRGSGRIAQLVEQLTLNQRVQGSSPCAPTTNLPLNQSLKKFSPSPVGNSHAPAESGGRVQIFVRTRIRSGLRLHSLWRRHQWCICLEFSRGMCIHDDIDSHWSPWWARR